MSTILTTEQIKQRQQLTRKLIDDSLTKDEVKQLQSILEIEKVKAVELKDPISLFAIFLLLKSTNDALKDILRLTEK